MRTNTTIPLNQNDYPLILICAFRYALGRATYMPHVVSEEIIRQWSNLSMGHQKLFQNEIRDAIELGQAGMECDIKTWGRILELPIKEG